jgi:hypothetical protein
MNNIIKIILNNMHPYPFRIIINKMIRKYESLPWVETKAGPQRSGWTYLNVLLELCTSTPNFTLCCCLMCSYHIILVYSIFLVLAKPCLASSTKPVSLTWHNLKCHNLVMLAVSTLTSNELDIIVKLLKYINHLF